VRAVRSSSLPVCICACGTDGRTRKSQSGPDGPGEPRSPARSPLHESDLLGAEIVCICNSSRHQFPRSTHRPRCAASDNTAQVFFFDALNPVSAHDLRHDSRSRSPIFAQTRQFERCSEVVISIVPTIGNGALGWHHSEPIPILDRLHGDTDPLCKLSRSIHFSLFPPFRGESP
jgi:hypothetical protein